MTEEFMRKILFSFGFRKREVDVYVFLAVRRPNDASEISDALNIGKNQTYDVLRRLQRKEMVRIAPSIPTLFLAVPFDKVLDSIVEASTQQADRLEQKKEVYLEIWRSR